MTPRSKGLLAISATLVLTVVIPVLREYDLGNIRAVWFIWFGVAWNYFAYAFDKGMFPRAFVELDGHGKGRPGYRTFYFWGTLGLHLVFLGTMAFADK